MKYKVGQWLGIIGIVCLLIASVNSVRAQSRSPILVLGSEKNFGSYIPEILKTEGFNEYQMEPVADAALALKNLQRFDIVILAQGDLTGRQASMITAYVAAGGKLIACRPDPKLNAVFGITREGGTLNEGYMAIDSGLPIGKGLTTETLQLHVEAERYIITGGKKIATLYKDAITTTVYPAVVMNDFGKGHAMAFLYNLPQNIVYTRQGNYRNAGKEMDGINGIRAMDMFTNGWLDTTKNTLNQADEQMRLLSHGIESLSTFSKPLPRFWYFPDSLKCLVTLTNDGEDSREEEFVPQYAGIDTMGAKMTLYIKETHLISKAWVDKWLAKGFEMAAHFDDTKQAPDPDWKTMDSVYKDLKRKIATRYDIHTIKTVTNHWFVWCGKDLNEGPDFAAQAKLEADNGIGLDNNYARYDNQSNQGYFLGAMGTGQGNFTGSGLSMKFSDNNGKVINCYQHICNVYDQQYMEHMDSVGIYNCFRGLMDRSLQGGAYSYISVKAHNAEYFFSKIPLTKMLDYANSNHIPVWTAAKLYDFLVAKDQASFDNLAWSANQLTFTIRSSVTHTSGITAMIPYMYRGNKIDNINS